MQNRKIPLVLLAAIAFVLAFAIPSFSQTAGTNDRFSGTWHWMFNGKSFATLILARSESGYSGSLSGVHIELNDDGSLKVAEPTENPSPAPIKKASIESSDLHITIMDGDDPMEWIMTLKDDTHAEIRWAAADGPRMNPIPLEKAR